MFDGMPDQFYQFLAAATATSRATTAATTTPHVAETDQPLSFSLHHVAPNNTFPIQQHPPFDPSFLLNTTNNHHPQISLLQQTTRNEANKLQVTAPPQQPVQLLSLQEESCVNMPWSNEEVLALLKIRSSLDNSWFHPHDFTWENVSRKLAEIGFKRSAEKCKEKFEEETRSFHNTNDNVINSSNNKNICQNYRLFGELEELYTHSNNNNVDCSNHDGIHGDHPHHESPPTLDDHNDHDHDHGNHDSSQVGSENVVQEKLVANDDGGGGDGDDEQYSLDDDDDDGDGEKTVEETTKKVSVRKRKRSQEKKFEMFKGFCEKIVNKMMAQQEELHCKILQDMVKRDEEKIAREEDWKRQEIERISKEIQVRADEQIIVGDRQAKILEFLNKFSSSNPPDTQSLRDILENLMVKVPKPFFSSTSSILFQDSLSGSQPTSSCSTLDHIQDQNKNPTPNILISSSNENLASQSSNLAQPITLSSLSQTLQNPNNHHVSQNESLVTLVSTHKSFGSDHTSTNAKDRVLESSGGNVVKDDTGRRWPRDEVLALINIRCNLFTNNGDQHDHNKDSFSKGPLWEKISQKMLELGYKRSAKRCKEKWENINKYFRKTKDLNKKRSVDSRTCPYFYQLSHLYSQGAVNGSSDRSANAACSPENQPIESSPGAQGGSNASNVATTIVHAVSTQVNEGTQVVQVPGLDFEF